MSAVLPNLARRPFVNSRPVARIALLLALAGALLLVLNLALYADYSRTRRANTTHLVEVEQRIATEASRVRAASSALTDADLGRQNSLVEYLNHRIEERTFAWSVLFDRLATLLPGEVRLVTLAPRFVDPENQGPRTARRRGEAEPVRRVELSMQGAASDGDAILRLVDALFADPAFENPNLNQEARQQGEISFTLSVTYLPQVAEVPRGAAVESGVENGAAASAAGTEDPGASDDDDEGDET
jgi:Tfp pilus assembly protein PilN